MIFTTYWFLAFALVAAAGFRLIPSAWYRQWWLVLCCALFHWHYAGPAGVAPIIVLMAVTYGAGLSRQAWAQVAAIVACVAALCFYKYLAFLIGSLVAPLDPTLAVRLAGTGTRLLPSLPPLGISFFVFEFVHYLIEVRRGHEPIRNPLRFVAFAIFFPSLVAGPIKRYAQFLPSLERAEERAAPASDVANGLAQVALGFAKKLLVADPLTTYIDHYQPLYDSQTLTGKWVIFAAIALRILTDFSGYSDIAIGCALVLGIRLPANFNWPYAACSVRDFWTRWHISLSRWIRDYVYIPLGGGRRGWPRRILNGAAAFALCGLWHGPALHFVDWGLYHGVGLGICTAYPHLPAIGKPLAAVVRRDALAGWVLTQLFVWVGWLLFFYPAGVAVHMARQLFGL